MRQRKQPCRQCRSSKTKCTFDTPCARCVKKSLACDYRSLATRGHVSVPATPIEDSTIAVDSRHAVGMTNSSNPTGVQDTLQAVFTLPELEMAMDTPWIEIDVQPLSSSKSYHDLPLPTCISRWDGFVPDDLFWVSSSIAPWSTWKVEDKFCPGLMNVSPQAHPETAYADSRIVRRRSNAIARSSARQICSILRSFPRAMLRRETFPAFIGISADKRLPEPLANCMSISQMFVNATAESMPFIWRTIIAEQTRLATDSVTSTSHDLLARIQVFIIYFIMMLVDYESLCSVAGQASATLQALHSFHMLCERFSNSIGESFCAGELVSPSRSREDWIFNETRRRVSSTWFVLTCVVSIETSIPCASTEHWRALPLPSPKTLWEARDEEEWERERSAAAAHTDNTLHSFGDLLDQCDLHDVRSRKRMDVWHTGIDSLGLMLGLCTDLI